MLGIFFFNLLKEFFFNYAAFCVFFSKFLKVIKCTKERVKKKKEIESDYLMFEKF